MQHMFPQLLTQVDTQAVVDRSTVPPGAVPVKSLGALITGAIGAVAGAVGNVANARAGQVIAREQTLQADIMARSAAEQRAANLAAMKYLVPAGLVGLALYLLFK